jgi:uncharacterized Zn finger protein (UPF0148 family)
MSDPANICPHCGAATAPGQVFCASCGRRLTSVEPESRLRRLLRVLRFVKPADMLGEHPEEMAEVYKRAPTNHPR